MDLAIAVVIASLHLDGLNTNPEGYNQFNPGVVVEVNDWDVGTYKNSYRHQTSFIAWSPYHGIFRPFVGAVEGYQGHIPVFGKISPAFGLGIEPWHRSGPVWTVTPLNDHGIVLSFSWKEKL
jgi:hypothetical protein